MKTEKDWTKEAKRAAKAAGIDWKEKKRETDANWLKKFYGQYEDD